MNHLELGDETMVKEKEDNMYKYFKHIDVINQLLDEISGGLFLSSKNKNNIKIISKSMGGTKRRSISFDVGTGRVFCAEGDEKEKLLADFLSAGNGSDHE